MNQQPELNKIIREIKRALRRNAPCPTCGADPHQHCIAVGGRPRLRNHHARVKLYNETFNPASP